MALAPTPLPIDPLLPALAASLRACPSLVLTAEPGAGKTTRVPRALLDLGLLGDGECWVLEPRRLAARLAAARVAQEFGEDLGQRAGYAVRFDQKVSRATRIRFVTEGLLLRRLQGDPGLRGIACVVLDEFHERHLQTDLALALLRRLQRSTRPDLRLVVMSATLDPAPVAAFLEAPAFKGEGRPFPVETRHAPRTDDRPLERQVAQAVEALCAGGGPPGHTLVFLPGAAEIRACARELGPLAQRAGLRVLPLHGDLGWDAQAEALAPSAQPKVLLSTSLAESSVTLEGIAAVVDSGLGREAFHSPWSGLPGLRTVRISQARCRQRGGRAGRTGPGLCLRLFTEADFQARPPYDEPELFRADLAEPLLALHALGLGDPLGLDWLEAPPAPALEAAGRLLQRLGALAGDGGLSATGARMAALPLHPRLARLVVAGEDAGIPLLARLGAVLLETGDLAARRGLDRTAAAPGGPVDSDLLVRLDQYLEAAAGRFAPGALRAAGLDPGTAAQARRAFASLAKGAPAVEDGPAAETLLRKALLRAFPDRVARVGGATLALVGGGGAALGPETRVRRAEFLVALEAEGAGTGRTRATVASAVDPEWLLEAFPERIQDREDLAFDEAKGRVESRSGLWYEDLCLDERRRPAAAGDPGVAACLAAAVARLAPASLEARLAPLIARCAFLAEARPDLGLPPGPDLRARLLDLACGACASLADLGAVDWTALLRGAWPEAARLLPAWAPEEVQLPRRRVKVTYGEGPPWVASRLQDFLGMQEGPRIAGGRVPLVLHLLAPNQRAVQVTTDLAGFWQRAYRELRPQLSRRYPRHLWPEQPGGAPEAPGGGSGQAR